tara:strand:- start:1516 stop:1782 length:267 start_codon:yes stop_codon:yes gene_type:complete
MTKELADKKDRGFILTLEEEKQLEMWMRPQKGGHDKKAGIITVPTQATPKHSRGLGDTIAKFTTKLGIKPCGGCKQRQEKLNKFLPYK